MLQIKPTEEFNHPIDRNKDIYSLANSSVAFNQNFQNNQDRVDQMQIVIDIPDRKWKTIQEGMYCGLLDGEMYNAIKNGTPLEDIKAEIHTTAGDYFLSDEWIDKIFDKHTSGAKMVKPQDVDKENKECSRS